MRCYWRNSALEPRTHMPGKSASNFNSPVTTHAIENRSTLNAQFHFHMKYVPRYVGINPRGAFLPYPNGGTWYAVHSGTHCAFPHKVVENQQCCMRDAEERHRLARALLTSSSTARIVRDSYRQWK
jgi:hypothetical protein